MEEKAKKSKKSKVLASVAAVVLAFSMLLGAGTYAYLTDETDDVTNTFSTNQVTVDLEETTGDDYEIIPGTSQAKDPTVTVNNTVDAYVFVVVTDTTDGLVEYAIADGWTLLDGYDNVYYRAVGADDEIKSFSVLAGDTVYYSAALENSDMLDEDGNLKDGLELTFKAYAIQMEPFANAVEAWAAKDAVNIYSFEEFMEAVNEGKENIIIADNVDFATRNTAIQNATVTVNLNGKTVSNQTNTLNYGVFYVLNNATLIINGDGIVNGVSSDPDGYHTAVCVESASGKIVINGGYYTNVGATSPVEGDDHFDLIYAANGVIEINGGTFKCETPKWTLNLQDTNGADGTAQIIVRGGTFYEFDPSQATTEPNVITNYVADGYTVITEEKEDGTWYTVVPE